MKWVTVCFDSLTCVPCNHTMYECSKCRGTISLLVQDLGNGWFLLCNRKICSLKGLKLNGGGLFSSSDSHPLSTNLIVCNSPKYYRWTMVSAVTKLSLSAVLTGWAGLGALQICWQVPGQSINPPTSNKHKKTSSITEGVILLLPS